MWSLKINGKCLYISSNVGIVPGRVIKPGLLKLRQNTNVLLFIK